MISTPCPIRPEFWFRSYQLWSHETIFVKQKGLDVIFGRTSHHGRLESDTYAAAVTGARRESGDIFLVPSCPVSLRSQRQLSPRSITRSTFNHRGQANTITAGSLPKIHSNRLELFAHSHIYSYSGVQGIIPPEPASSWYVGPDPCERETTNGSGKRTLNPLPARSASTTCFNSLAASTTTRSQTSAHNTN